MTTDPPAAAGIDEALPADLGFDAIRAAQAERWAATTPDQRLELSLIHI